MDVANTDKLRDAISLTPPSTDLSRNQFSKASIFEK